MKRTAFFLDVTDEDTIDVWFDVDRGRVVAFSVNYRALVGKEWTEVIRYDTAHDQMHVHEFWPAGTERVVSLEESPSEDYTEALSMALDDLDAHWTTYRKKMEEGA